MLAQIVQDGSTPTNLEECSTQCTRVMGGTIRGRNLFHSFTEFNVGERQQVRFANPNGIENILTRVTGDSPSRIRGTLGIEEGGANLFLLNPNGILFGRNARLDLRGSFVATTANSFVFPNDAEFSASNSQAPPLLAVNVPMGLQFGQAPGEIRSRGDLQVAPNRTLALVGGNIILSDKSLAVGGLNTAVGGRIELGSVTTARVDLSTSSEGFVLGYKHVQNFQNIRLSNFTVGFSNFSQAILIDEVGSTIQIWGNEIILDRSRIISSTRSGTGGEFRLNAAGSVRLRGSLIQNLALDGGRTGDVAVRAGRDLALTEASGVNSISEEIESISGENDSIPARNVIGGTLTINTGNSIALREGSFISIDTRSRDDNGDLIINTQRLLLQNSGIKNGTSDIGRAGNIRIRASDIQLFGVQPTQDEPGRVSPPVIVAEAAEGSQGDAGNIDIRTDRLIAQEGGQISTTTFGSGNAGRLAILATDSIRLSGAVGDFSDLDNLIESGLFASAEPGATGDAGTVDITTPNLTVENGAAISVRNFGRQGGTLNITANSILLDGGERRQARLTAFTAAESEIGQGIGTINIQDPDLLIMRNGSRISAASITDANLTAGAGNIHIDAPDGFLIAAPQQDNDIFASAFAGRGGNINITVRGVLGFEGYEERTFVEGNGTNDIDASSRFGISGTVSLSAINLDPTQGLTELPITPIATELVQGCQVEGGQAAASFFDTGHGGLPPTPYEPLSSDDILSDVRLPSQVNILSDATSSVASTTTTQNSLKNSITEAESWRVNDRGQLILIATASPEPLAELCHLR
ncbi:MAG: filamentous hemagglutinin N-terminal domain-containing protein [Drouetiella hepatica Uher 2000/2452]|uniref:Filamentous hemagglutinin N-terminal domain-containing protein n=1 Tax=Drouetiella hepatica Uher 2000/2452 TaxID=904376 RepID=A0A951UQS7_9CYAN|nr:filamentous hemagglutinin N-terminal domain-containing protein [Drouetiella hepatica Uher 2000/2452]